MTGSYRKLSRSQVSAANQWTFTPPVWADGTAGLKYGDVSVNVTDGTVATAIFSDTLDPESGLGYANMEAVGPYNYVDAAGSTPALENRNAGALYNCGGRRKQVRRIQQRNYGVRRRYSPLGS